MFVCNNSKSNYSFNSLLSFEQTIIYSENPFIYRDSLSLTTTSVGIEHSYKSSNLKKALNFLLIISNLTDSLENYPPNIYTKYLPTI